MPPLKKQTVRETFDHAIESRERLLKRTRSTKAAAEHKGGLKALREVREKLLGR